MSVYCRGEKNIYVLTTWVVLVVELTLIWGVRYPPLVDYPNHLARCYILFHLRDVPEFREWYVAHWVPVPNLAMDALLYLLQYAFKVEVAGKLVLSLVVVLFAAGAVALSRALWGDISWSVPLAASFALNSALLYGFVNYCLGLGLYLCLLAAWLRRCGSQRSRCVFATSAYAGLCYLTHLSAYVCFAVSVLLYILFVERCKRSLLIHSTMLAAVFLFFSLWSDTRYGAQVSWNTLTGKISVLLPMVRTYSWRFDLFYLFVITVGIFILLEAGRSVRIDRYASLVCVSFVVLFMALPKEMTTVSGVDARFVLPGVIMFLMCLIPKEPRLTGIKEVALFTVYAFVLLRLVCIGWQWNMIDAEARRYAETFGFLRRGSWVYPLVALPEDVDANKRERSFVHFVHYATIRRKTFSPTLFTIPGQQPLRRSLEEPYREAAEISPESINWQHVLLRYDYLWCYNVPDNMFARFGSKLHMIAKKGKVTVYRVRRDAKPLSFSLPSLGTIPSLLVLRSAEEVIR